MQNQLPAADLRRRLLRQIVLRRPETPGEDHNIRALHRRPQHHLQPLRIITHHCLKVAGKSQSCALLGEIRRVGVDDISK